MARHKLYPVSTDEGGLRVDRWLMRHFPHLSHGVVQKSLRRGDIRVAGKRVAAQDRTQEGDVFQIFEGLIQPVPGRHAPRPESSPPSKGLLTEAEKLCSGILYQDADIVVLNKPQGLATQGGTGVTSHVEKLLDLSWEREGLDERPYLVHRLDRDTSGVLVVACHATAAAALSAVFRERQVQKTYRALVVGSPKENAGNIALPIRKRPGRLGQKMEVAMGEPLGLSALTHFTVLEQGHPPQSRAVCSWLALEPHTGRMHQLRVHCAALGCPIVGDGPYGASKAFPFGRVPLHLHAHSLRFPHPRTGESLVLTAPLPPHMQSELETL